MSKRRRVSVSGVFGGSFDPIHGGHLLLAELAREQLHLMKCDLCPQRFRAQQGSAADGYGSTAWR